MKLVVHHYQIYGQHKKKVTIIPLPLPSTPLPIDSRRTLAGQGGGVTEYLFHTRENIGGIVVGEHGLKSLYRSL